jgi:hypothetical protein
MISKLPSAVFGQAAQLTQRRLYFHHIQRSGVSLTGQ